MQRRGYSKKRLILIVKAEESSSVPRRGLYLNDIRSHYFYDLVPFHKGEPPGCRTGLFAGSLAFAARRIEATYTKFALTFPNRLHNVPCHERQYFLAVLTP